MSPYQFITKEGKGDRDGGAGIIDIKGGGGGPDAIVVVSSRDPGDVLGK